MVLPSQAPPQREPSLAQDGRRPPLGCGVPLTAVQVPWLPATSHAWHWPAQAWSQQNPSAQKPLEH